MLRGQADPDSAGSAERAPGRLVMSGVANAERVSRLPADSGLPPGAELRDDDRTLLRDAAEL